MTTINARTDCGNSPKARTLQDFVVAIGVADADLLSKLVSDDVVWTPIGAKPVSGAPAVCRALTRHGPATSLSIDHVIVHGRSGAVDGTSEYRRKRRAFYIVVDFTNAKGQRIGSITSFSTDISKPSVA